MCDIALRAGGHPGAKSENPLRRNRMHSPEFIGVAHNVDISNLTIYHIKSEYSLDLCAEIAHQTGLTIDFDDTQHHAGWTKLPVHPEQHARYIIRTMNRIRQGRSFSSAIGVTHDIPREEGE